MSEQDYISKYWNYYLNIERSIMELENYITFDERNFNCFSIEFIKMFQMICSEIDVVLKLITSKSSMKGYKEYLLNNEYKEIVNSEANLILKINLSFNPFSLLDLNTKLKWWEEYNNVKHDRLKNDNYTQANLKNVLESLAALYILESFYYNIKFYKKDENSNYSVPTPKSKLFSKVSNLEDNVIENIMATTISEC